MAYDFCDNTWRQELWRYGYSCLNQCDFHAPENFYSFQVRGATAQKTTMNGRYTDICVSHQAVKNFWHFHGHSWLVLLHRYDDVSWYGCILLPSWSCPTVSRHFDNHIWVYRKKNHWIISVSYSKLVCLKLLYCTSLLDLGNLIKDFK